VLPAGDLFADAGLSLENVQAAVGPFGGVAAWNADDASSSPRIQSPGAMETPATVMATPSFAQAAAFAGAGHVVLGEGGEAEGANLAGIADSAINDDAGDLAVDGAAGGHFAPDGRADAAGLDDDHLAGLGFVNRFYGLGVSPGAVRTVKAGPTTLRPGWIGLIPKSTPLRCMASERLAVEICERAARISSAVLARLKAESACAPGCVRLLDLGGGLTASGCLVTARR